jgi:cytochrome c oxidase subunit II
MGGLGSRPPPPTVVLPAPAIRIGAAVRPPTSRLPKIGRVLAVAIVVMAACAAPASAAIAPDASHSPNADTIRTSYWVMLVVATLIGLALLGGLLVAARRFRAREDAEVEPRRLTAGRGAIGRVGGILGAVAVAIFVFGVVVTGDAREAEADAEADSLNIDVVGQQWLWRFEYPVDEEAGATTGIATVFSYNELVVPVDTTVNLSIDSTDVVHRWFIPSLGGQVEAVPGEVAETSFRADEEGVYEGQSTEFSGTGFPAMRAWVRVISREEYDQYVTDLADDLSAAQEAVTEGPPSGEGSE